jgi:hypothetical protein
MDDGLEAARGRRARIYEQRRIQEELPTGGDEETIDMTPPAYSMALLLLIWLGWAWKAVAGLDGLLYQDNNRAIDRQPRPRPGLGWVGKAAAGIGAAGPAALTAFMIEP